MFEIYMDDKLVYSQGLVNIITQPHQSQELGKSGELTFIVPTAEDMYKGDINNKGYDILKSFFYVKKDGHTIWSGRILRDEKDFYGMHNITCEGRLSWLNDNVAYRYSFGYGLKPPSEDYPYYIPDKITLDEFFTRIIFLLNRHQFSNKDFKKGTMNVTPKVSETTFAFKSDEFNQALDEIQEKLCNDVRFGGYLDIHYDDNDDAYLDYLEFDQGRETGQKIELGENLLDFTDVMDASDFYTVIVPFGDTVQTEDSEESKRLDIYEVNDHYYYYPKAEDWNKDLPECKLLQKYGAIAKVVNFDGVKDANVLLEKAKQELKTVKLIDSITLSAFDLSLINVEYDDLRLGDMVQIISIPHGVNQKAQCIKVELDFDNPENNRYTFGFVLEELTDKDKKKNGADDMADLYDSWNMLYPRTDAEIQNQNQGDSDSDDSADDT